MKSELEHDHGVVRSSQPLKPCVWHGMMLMQNAAIGPSQTSLEHCCLHAELPTIVPQVTRVCSDGVLHKMCSAAACRCAISTKGLQQHRAAMLAVQPAVVWENSGFASGHARSLNLRSTREYLEG